MTSPNMALWGIQRAAPIEETCASQSGTATHNSGPTNQSINSHWDIQTRTGTSHTGAWCAQLNMRLGRSDTPEKDIDDVNKKQYNLTVILDETR